MTSLRATLRARVRHSSIRFGDTDRLYPDVYPRVLVRGEGAYLWDDQGHRVLDGGGHLGAGIVGHGRAEIAEAMADQARTLEWSSLDLGLSHGVAAQLSERLAVLVPVGDPQFLLGSTGSEANETAFKVARAFHRNRGEVGRVKIIGRDGSYHGATFGAMSASGIPEASEAFAPLVPGFLHCSQPSPGRCGFCSVERGCSLECARDVERAILREDPRTVAAVIAEPVAFRQAIKVPADGYWPMLREICDRHGVLLIVDEVITGFGRTGRLFGLEHWGVEADILTLGKGITSGYLPLAATLVARPIAAQFAEHPLSHISTYAGHPVACRAAVASLDIIEREGLVENAASGGAVASECLTRLCADIDAIRAVSAIGLLTSIEFTIPEGVPAGDMTRRVLHDCYERGLIVRAVPSEPGGVLYFYPPLIVTEREIRDAFAVIGEVLAATVKG